VQGSPVCAAEAHNAARSATVVALGGSPLHLAAPPSPVPDRFSYTTDMGTPGFAGEPTTRHFNLTHEWGMELIYYLVLSRTDFQG
jgi:hypothetical protein